MVSLTLPSNGRLVNIGTHSFVLYTNDPDPSSSEDPAVAFISGATSGALIGKASVTSPLVLVGHSWAGVIIQEYIALEGADQIAGVVSVDASHETAPLVMNVNDPILWGVVTANADP
ncbi:hypothetical protein SCARD494_12403 [Seiridium cardinale]